MYIYIYGRSIPRDYTFPALRLAIESPILTCHKGYPGFASIVSKDEEVNVTKECPKLQII